MSCLHVRLSALNALYARYLLPMKKFGSVLVLISSFKFDSCFGSTGEASNVDEYLWLMGRAQYKPIMEYCGGTEIGGGFISGSFLQPQSLAAFSTPAMGCSLFLIGDDGIPLVRTITTYSGLLKDMMSSYLCAK